MSSTLVKLTKLFIYNYQSDPVLVRGNATNAYTSYQSSSPESSSQAWTFDTRLWIPQKKLSLNPTYSPWLEPGTDFRFVAFPTVISVPKQFFSRRRSFVSLSFRTTEHISTRNWTQKFFWSRDICFSDVLLKEKNFCLGAVLPSCLVSEV